jgi:hypothetical protein
MIFPGVDRFEDLRPFFAVVIVAWIAAFALRPTRGRTLFLGLALLLTFSWAIAEVADVSPRDVVPTPITSSSDFGSSSSDFLDQAPEPVTPSEPNWGEMGGVALVFAFVYLVGVAVLDGRGRRGLATAAVLPGVIALITAIEMFSVESRNAVVTGVLSIAAGLFCGTVGAQSHRRFMVWTGAFLATGGAIILSYKVTDAAVDVNDSSGHAATVFGLFTMLFGAAMVVVGALVARVLREPAGGDEVPPPAVAAS